MLRELHLSHFVLIHDCHLELGNGLTIFTGETGAGKSLLVDALKWLLGGRSFQEAIAEGSDGASVEAVFELEAGSSAHARAAAVLTRYALIEGSSVPDPLILRRSVNREGKSRAYLNDRPVTASLVSELGEILIDMTGQHEGQGLLKPALQRGLLDETSADIRSLRKNFQETWQRYIEQDTQYQAFSLRLDNLKREEEYIRYQVDQLKTVPLSETTEEVLMERRQALKSVAAWRELSANAYSLFGEGQGTFLTECGRWLRQFETLSREANVLNTDYGRCAEALEGLREIYHRVSEHSNKLCTSDEDLDALEAQVSTIKHLRRKYQLSIAELIQQKQRWEADLAWLEEAPLEHERESKERQALKEKVIAQAEALSKARRDTALAVEEKVGRELRALGMANAHFSIAITSFAKEEWERWSEAGKDHVEFLFSANVGQAARPLAKIASGGELSRTLLAIKASLSAKHEGSTFLFDEVDAGIGGETADLVGKTIARLGKQGQVLCVTHLPQVARYGDAHFAIDKVEANGRTRSSIRQLNRNEKTDELTRMLGGEKLSRKTRELAQEIVASRAPQKSKKATKAIPSP